MELILRAAMVVIGMSILLLIPFYALGQTNEAEVRAAIFTALQSDAAAEDLSEEEIDELLTALSEKAVAAGMIAAEIVQEEVLFEDDPTLGEDPLLVPEGSTLEDVVTGDGQEGSLITVLAVFVGVVILAILGFALTRSPAGPRERDLPFSDPEPPISSGEGQ